MKKLKGISILFIINLMIFLFVGLSLSEDTNEMNNSEEPINNSSEVGKNNSGNKRFVDNGDGTVTDLEINLMWLNKPKFFLVIPFDKAVDYCKNLNYNNLTGWRLPTILELQSILDEKQLPPALIFGHPFKNINTRHFYWTQTQDEHFNRIYVASLYDGKIGTQSKEIMAVVWPVRDIE